MRLKPNQAPCQDVHFKKIINPHTDESLGNCSYLDTCRHMDYCRYIHYKIDDDEEKNSRMREILIDEVKNRPKQWINCDLREFDFTVLGDCSVIMLDPPWDIHMNVGTE
jgi:mRNA (2'-O-methyladenosine-N6-)-methyltransferase